MRGLTLKRARIVAAVATVGLGAFVAAVVAEVAPDSIAAQQARRVTRPLMHPLFAQRWSLFAPEVPRTNFTTYLEVRYTTDEGGQEQTAPLADVSDSLDASVKRTRWAPNRSRRIVTALEIQAANFSKYRATLDGAQARHPGKPLPEALTKDIERRGSALRNEYTRFLSSLAPDAVPPGATPVGVRAVVSAHGIPRLGRGADPNNPMTRTAVVYDSGWLPALEGVSDL